MASGSADRNILWTGKPYMKKTAVEIIVVAVVLLIIVALIDLMMSGGILGFALPAIVILVLVAIIGVPYYYSKRAYTYYIKDNSVLITKKWIFGTYSREITYDQILDIHISQGPIAKAFNAGSLIFVTSTGLEIGYTVTGGGGYTGAGRFIRGGVFGGGGTVTPHVRKTRGNAFSDIQMPESVKDIIMSQIVKWREAFQQQRIATGVEAIASARVAEELAKLKELLDKGAITQEEYEKAKKKLLEQQ